MDDDSPDVYKNLAKARTRWGMVSQVLRCDKLRPKAAAMFYKAVVQSVLLFGSETWVLSPSMLKALEGFHHRVARQLSGKVGWYLPREDRWVYPPISEVLEEAGLFSIGEYLSHHQNCIAEYVSTRPIFELCTETNVLDGSASQRQFWWNKEVFETQDSS